MKFLLTMVGALALPVFAADLDKSDMTGVSSVSYTHLRAHET